MCDMICGVYIVVFQGSGGGTMIVWNHLHSWGHIFMHCQFFFPNLGNVISWMKGLFHYNVRHFITSVNVRRNV